MTERHTFRHPEPGDIDELVRRSVGRLTDDEFAAALDRSLDTGIHAESPATDSRPAGGTTTSGNDGWRGRWAQIGIAVAASLVFGAMLVTSLQDETTTVVTPPPVSTTPTTSTATTVPVEHLPSSGDRSPELTEQLRTLRSAVLAETGVDLGNPNELGVGDYFSAKALFPDLAPLPARTVWKFINHLQVPEGPCHTYAPEAITMTGFAAHAFISASSTVIVATYTLSDPDDLQRFFLGRSLQLGVEEEECTARGAELTAARARAITLPPATSGNNWNTWSTAESGQLLGTESRADSGIIVTDDQILELRVGYTDEPAASTIDLPTIARIAASITAPSGS